MVIFVCSNLTTNFSVIGKNFTYLVGGFLKEMLNEVHAGLRKHVSEQVDLCWPVTNKPFSP